MEHYSFPDTNIPPSYGPYSHAVVVGNFVFLAGQIARDPVSGHLIEGDITVQTARCLEIVSDILKSLGLCGRCAHNSLSVEHWGFRRCESRVLRRVPNAVSSA